MVTLRLIMLAFSILLTSCSTDKGLERYCQLIDECDAIKIYELTNYGDKLVKDIGSADDLDFVKSILKRNIKPELSRQFKTRWRFDVVDDEKVVGQIFISESGDEPFASFVAHDFELGFKLTYSLGMYLTMELR